MISTSQLVNRTLSRYGRKIASPEWKQFAKEAYLRVGCCCQSCRLGDRVLNVHHIFYKDGAEPWEYSNDEVVVLCETCHKSMHEELQKFRKHVFGKLNPQSFRVLNGALSVAVTKYDPLAFAHAMAEFVSTPSMIKRYADSWK